jgi:hypothetical protein
VNPEKGEVCSEAFRSGAGILTAFIFMPPGLGFQPS